VDDVAVFDRALLRGRLTRQVVVIVNTNVDHDHPIAAAMRELIATAYCEG
jgi:hypothetical protein